MATVRDILRHVVRHKRMTKAPLPPSWASRETPPPVVTTEELTPREARVLDILVRYIRRLNNLREEQRSPE